MRRNAGLSKTAEQSHADVCALIFSLKCRVGARSWTQKKAVGATTRRLLAAIGTTAMLRASEADAIARATSKSASLINTFGGPA